MSEIRFYHLTKKRLEDTLPVLLEKTMSRQWRAVVMVGSDERAEALASFLWTFTRESFLPHGTKKDGHATEQPIWITSTDENPNKANILFLTDGATTNKLQDFEIVCEIFDGHDEKAVGAARTRWTQYKDGGHALTYWQQSATGGWHKQS